MSYRTYNIRHSLIKDKDDFSVAFVERSIFKNFVGQVANVFCAATGHHFCNSAIISPMLWWADKDEKVISVVPITREVADKLSHPGAWAWLDDEPAE